MYPPWHLFSFQGSSVLALASLLGQIAARFCCLKLPSLRLRRQFHELYRPPHEILHALIASGVRIALQGLLEVTLWSVQDLIPEALARRG